MCSINVGDVDDEEVELVKFKLKLMMRRVITLMMTRMRIMRIMGMMMMMMMMKK